MEWKKKKYDAKGKLEFEGEYLNEERIEKEKNMIFLNNNIIIYFKIFYFKLII